MADHQTTPGPQQMSTAEVTAAAERFRADYKAVRDQIGRAVVGHSHIVDGVLVCLFAGGHALLEGVPGIGKTLLIRSLSRAVHLDFSRIQFTPDLMPADISGTTIVVEAEGDGGRVQREFRFQPGPVFSQIVLADEINRATPKTQSALLEAMQEKSVTVQGTTHKLPKPFFVMATQNPLEQEGTYPLPEAQVDRFMLKLSVGYPTKAEEREVVRRMASTKPKMTVDPVVSLQEIMHARELVDAVFVDDKIHDYAVELVHTTREPGTLKGPASPGSPKGTELGRLIEFGASPRATIALVLASKACAFLAGRDYVSPSDVKSIAPDVMRHRIIPSYEAEAENISTDDIVRTVLDNCPVP